MDRHTELKLVARIMELGEGADGAALPELAQLCGSSSARLRRLAAAGIGKLAGLVPPDAAVAVLQPLLADTHPQTRQYAAKALGAFGAAAEKALPDLRDLYRNPAEKDYVKRSVYTAGITIKKAVEIAAASRVQHCRRCGVKVSADEFARSQKAFQRVFCDRCFDEVYLERRNFDTTVELNKTIQAKDGTLVQSDGERLICDVLNAAGIVYRYDERFRIIEGFAIRPDFYLPELDVYIEYWGMDTTDYKIGMLKKQKLYQQEGKRLISLYPKDRPRMREVLMQKLGMLK